MKKLFLLFFLTALFFNTSFSQWVTKSCGLQSNLYSVFFADSLVGFTGDASGKIAKTIDGGNNWTVSSYTAPSQLRYGQCTDASNVFFVGMNGLIIKSTDSGNNWITKNANTQNNLVEIHFPTSSTGYVVGDASTIVKTTDGGDTWLTLSSPINTDFRAVYFLDSLTGWVSGAYGVLIKTTNGGSSWTSYPGFPTQTLRSIIFTTQNKGFIAGNWGLMYKTTNKGLTWNQISVPSNAVFNNLFFVNENIGYAAGIGGTIIATTDGGTTWMNQDSGTLDDIFSICFTTTSKGFGAGGLNGHVLFLKTNNGGFPAPYINLTSPVGGESWLAGSSHQIKWTSQMVSYLNLDYTTNNGETWLSIATNYPGTLNSYSWIIPTTPSGNCKVRITDVSNASLFDISNGVFNINSISVTSPNGGECWQVLSNHNIHWASTNVINVNLDYSSNNGSTWNSIIQEYTNSGTYIWTIPNITSNTCKIKVSDAGNTSNYDISDATFSLTPEVVQAKITADTLYFDSDFLGSVSKQISGSTSIGVSLTYTWLINDVDIYSGISPTVTFHTGLNKIKLQVTGTSGANSSDSLFTNIVASKNITGGAIYSGISEYNNRFYLTSTDKAVYEIDSIGRKTKTFLAGGSIQSVLTISPSGKLFTGSTDTRLYSFDPNLIPIWDKATGGIIKYAPAISGDGSTVYCVTNTSNLIAYDVITGNLKWGFQTEGVVTSSPVVLLDADNNNIIYAGTSAGYLYAIKDNGSTGDLFWRKELSDTIYSSVAVYPNGQNTMLFTGSKGGYLYRIKWDGTFDENWKVNLNSPIYSSPVIDGGNTIYIGTKNGNIYGYSVDFTSNSNPLNSYFLGSGVIGTPAIGMNGKIYVGTEKGYLYTLSKNDSTLSLLWKANLYSSIISSALVTGTGLIYVGTLKGDVFVLKEPSLSRSVHNPIWPTYKGNNQRSKVFSINFTGINENETTISDYKLLQNYPNPFNPNTRIDYQAPYNSNIVIDIYSVTGEKVVTLVNKEQPAGFYSVDLGSTHNLSSGIYFYRMIATSTEGNHNYTSIKKMILLK